MKNNKLKNIPSFKNDLEETAFWQEHDTADYIDWAEAKSVSFPNLKPSTKTISLRLSESLLNEIKTLANKEDVPYQSFMKVLLAQGVNALRK
jgi:predicted DNA binding CopG/RHH family protein